jgi:uncharacterized phage protein gp47/JayE
MPITPPSYEELFLQFRTEMEQLGLNHWAEGSRVGAIGRVMAAYQADLWSALAFMEGQLNPSTATGQYLTKIGEMFGVTRQGPQYASTVGKGPTVKFTNNTGGSVTIPAGTRVWSSLDPTVAFTTTSSIVISAGQEGYADVVAVQAGEEYNIAAGQMNSHNLSVANVTVTNVRPVGGGTFPETDDAYRFRIIKALQARNGSVTTAIEQAVLKVPGVRDVVIHPYVRGNGSFDVIVVPIDRYASTALLEACKDAVKAVAAAGVSWKVYPPITRRVDLRIQLHLVAGATLASVKPQVEAAARAYIDNLRVDDGKGGSSLIYNELISRIQDASPDIVDSTVNLSVDGIPSLQTNITTNAGERLVSGSVTIT